MVVRWAESPLDQFEPTSFVKSTPGARRGAAGGDLFDLLDRAVFDERTDALAISHGVSPHLVVGRRREDWEGRDFSLAGDVVLIYVRNAIFANQTVDVINKLGL